MYSNGKTLLAHPLSFAAKVTTTLVLLFVGQACTPTSEIPSSSPAPEAPAPETPAPEAQAATSSWDCSNDIEISCDEQGCRAVDAGSFTPMSVQLASTGKMDVCAYSGCWQGLGSVQTSGDFSIWVGHDLSFSTAPSTENQQDIVVVLDLSDGVATLKAGAFAHPLKCTEQES